MSEVKKIQDKQVRSDEILSTLTAKVNAIETELTSLTTLKGDMVNLREASSAIYSDIEYLKRKCNDLENRSRRNNILIFGVDDSAEESWTDSQMKVVKLCQEKLGLSIDPNQIDRAHRLGHFQSLRPRPIIVRFDQFKIKESVLVQTKKLKGTPLAISEDYAPATRQARKELLKFARQRNEKFKLRFDKLIIGSTRYVYDATKKEVIAVSKD